MDSSRQWGADLSKIRRDHVERYLFAASRLGGKTVMDAACGIGYGSRILHDAGCKVVGVDVSQSALDWAERHYDGPEYLRADIRHPFLVGTEAVVSFETLEHLEDPRPTLIMFTQAKELICSVPNESHYPFDAEKFKDDEYPHFRHYTPAEFDALLVDAGWTVKERFCQPTKTSPLVEGTEGLFIIYVCECIPKR